MHDPVSCICTPEPLVQFRNPALVIGHPGHELRVFGWTSATKPRIYVITDGSGSHGVTRIPSTATLVDQLESSRDAMFGVVSDGDLYCAILDGNVDMFFKLLSGMAASFAENHIDFVVADAEEGFNPAHDLCRAIVNAAVRMAERSTGMRIANYAFYLTEWELKVPALHDEQCLHLRLDEELLVRKIAAAKSYVELRDEVERGVTERGVEYFRLECLRKVVPTVQPCADVGTPFYETYGERRVGHGKYSSVIRYKEHILPIMTAMFEYSLVANVGQPMRRRLA